MDRVTDDLLARFGREGDVRAFEGLVEMFRPLVYSVCRRYLRQAADVEDAAQETFAKLLRHGKDIHGNVGAWLAAAAFSASIDVIRRAERERRRVEALQMNGTAWRNYQVAQEALRLQLGEALLKLSEPERELVVERFYRKTPLRVLATKRHISLATMSRRVADAIHALVGILQKMGVEYLDDLTLAEHFGDPGYAVGLEREEVGLRFAADWRSPIGGAMPEGVGFAPEWRRAIRVGVMVSYRSVMTVGYRGIRHTMEAQVQTTGSLDDPRFQFVGVVEAGTTEHGIIERTLREYELTWGLVDAADAAGLGTLDVILLGLNFSLGAAEIKAIHRAVSAGTGLLNEFWTDMSELPKEGMRRELLDLYLADSTVYPYHAPPDCGTARAEARVEREHKVLGGMREGTTFMAGGCGPLYRVKAGAEVLMAKGPALGPETHGIAGLGEARLPVYVVGDVERGRVAVVHLYGHNLLIDHPAMGSDYLANLLMWLAEPRRE